jgi:hypothetical protein
MRFRTAADGRTNLAICARGDEELGVDRDPLAHDRGTRSGVFLAPASTPRTQAMP